MDGLFDRAASVLERRFLKNAFLPVFLFFPAAILPAAVQDGRLEDTIQAWNNQPIASKLLQVVAYFAAVWFIAAIVASQWRNIIRLYEGYPFSEFTPLDQLGKNWHRNRLLNLTYSEQPAPWYSVYYDYPAISDVLPTRLGNILRAAETYAYRRYEADTILLWPRLYHVMPREFVDDVEDARATLEFLLVISLWCTTFGLANVVIAALVGSSMPVAFVCLGFGLAGAYAAYLSALPAAAEYGEQLRSGFELYRFELLQRLKAPTPINLEEEHAVWRGITNFVGLNAETLWNYEDPGAPQLSVTIKDLQSNDGAD